MNSKDRSDAPAPDAPAPDVPQFDIQAAQQLLRSELSMSSRLPYVLLLLLATAMVIVIGSLWLTEPSLPMRTQGAFGVLCGIGVGWMVFCVWVLTQRRVLYARQQVISARLGMAFSALFAVGSAVIGLTQGAALGGLLAAGCGLVLFACAYGLHHRAERQHQALLQLRRSLEGHDTAVSMAA